MDPLEARRIIINNDQDDRLNKLEIRVGLIEERLEKLRIALPKGWELDIPVA